jgi:hypothetical protein
MALLPDLTFAKSQIGRLLFGADSGLEVPGEVEITRNTGGTADDVFNTTTGLWTSIDRDAVYSGAASFRANDPDRRFDSGGQVILRAEWSLKLPLDDLTEDTEPAEGDFVEITSCARDGHLVGKKFRIDRILGTSFATLRRCVMYEYHPVGRELP